MIVPFHSLNKKDRIEFYADERNRKLRDKILKDEYNIRTDMENLIGNIVELYDDVYPYEDFKDVEGYIDVCGGYESFDVIFTPE